MEQRCSYKTWMHERCVPAFARTSMRGRRVGSQPEFAQANLVMLPGEHAFDFLKFCVRNPKPCPVLEVTEAGSPEPVVTAPGADLRPTFPVPRLRARGTRGGATRT
jgi:uncharacterized protein YcsI (UPF0317 family)